MNRNPKSQINWRWFVGCEVAGTALIILAFWLEANHKWQGASEATLVAIGAALFLAGILFFVERRFITEVGEIAAQAAEEVASTRIEEANRGVGLRLEQLSSEIDELRHARAESYDEAVRAMDVPTFESIASALAVANELGALKNGHVTVQASEDPDELGLEFSWGHNFGDGRFRVEPSTTLSIQAIVYADFGRSGGRPVIAVDWSYGTSPSEDESAVEVAGRIERQLINRGRWNGASTLDFAQTLRNLQRALDLAISSRRRDEGGAWLRGALAELVSDEWGITDAGIECPGHRYILDGDLFPERYTMHSKKDGAFEPPAPAWLEDDALWRRLIGRGGRVLPVMTGPALAQPSWVPESRGPDLLRG